MPFHVDAVVAPGTLGSRSQPELTGAGLMLRPWRAQDAAVVVEAYSDPEIQHWHARSMRDVAEAERWMRDYLRAWRQELAASWAVTRDGELAGRIGLNRLNLSEGSAEIGYWVLPRMRGAGVAPRAVEVVTRWALEEVGLHRIELRHSTRNPRSCRVAERCGYALEGTLCQALRHDDGWHDMHLHARVAPS